MPYELNLEDGSSYAYLLLWNMSPIKLTTFINTWARNMNLRDSQLLKKQWHLHFQFLPILQSTKAKRVRGLHYDWGGVRNENPSLLRFESLAHYCEIKWMYKYMCEFIICQIESLVHCEITTDQIEILWNGSQRERGGPSIRFQLVLIPLLFLNQDHYKLEIGKAAKAGNFN